MPFNPTDYDAYLFDCDGTLIDSMGLHYEGWLHAFQTFYPATNFPRDLYQRMAGMESQKVIAAVGEVNGVTYPFDDLLVIKRDFYTQHLGQLGVIEEVARYARDKTHPQAIVTGGWRDMVELSLTATGLLTLFSHVVTFQDVPHGKPAPDMFLFAADKLGVDPKRCLVWEDGQPGEDGGLAAGMDVLRIDTSPWTLVRPGA